jgi:hypothetical protein
MERIELLIMQVEGWRRVSFLCTRKYSCITRGEWNECLQCAGTALPFIRGQCRECGAAVSACGVQLLVPDLHTSETVAALHEKVNKK